MANARRDMASLEYCEAVMAHKRVFLVGIGALGSRIVQKTLSAIRDANQPDSLLIGALILDEDYSEPPSDLRLRAELFLDLEEQPDTQFTASPHQGWAMPIEAMIQQRLRDRLPVDDSITLHFMPQTFYKFAMVSPVVQFLHDRIPGRHVILSIRSRSNACALEYGETTFVSGMPALLLEKQSYLDRIKRDPLRGLRGLSAKAWTLAVRAVRFQSKFR